MAIFWVWWVIASAVGAWIGMSWIGQEVWWRTDDRTLSLNAYMALLQLGVAVAQALVLRRYLRAAWVGWLVAGVLGAAVGMAAGVAAGNAAVTAVVGALTIELAHWLVLRRHIGSASGWLAGVVVSAPLANTATDWLGGAGGNLPAVALMQGAVVGVVTGAVLALILRRPRQEAVRVGWRAVTADLLTFFTYLWSAAVAVLVVAVWVRAFVAAPDIWEGVATWVEMVNPFNWGNYIVIALLLLPAIGANALSQRMKGPAPALPPAQAVL